MALGLCLLSWAWTGSRRQGFGFSSIPQITPTPEGIWSFVETGAGGKWRAEARPLRVVTSQGRPSSPGAVGPWAGMRWGLLQTLPQALPPSHDSRAYERTRMGMGGSGGRCEASMVSVRNG